MSNWERDLPTPIGLEIPKWKFKYKWSCRISKYGAASERIIDSASHDYDDREVWSVKVGTTYSSKIQYISCRSTENRQADRLQKDQACEETWTDEEDE